MMREGAREDRTRLPGWMLLLTVFVTGASVLVIELIGTRVLAPFFGSGIYTWSALIAVTLAALALGYSVGGRVADAAPRAGILYHLCLAAGAWTVITPWLATMLLPSLALTMEIRSAVLLSSVLLFFPNLFALGMACPFAIRLFYSDREASGSTSGRVFAVSTLGSLAAALLTGFVLVPNYGVLAILTACGATLIACAMFGLLALRWFTAGVLALLVACLSVAGALSLAPAEHDSLELVDSSPSFYGHVQVVRRHGLKLLLVNGILQNESADGREAAADYLRFFSSLPLLGNRQAGGQAESLVVGLGAGQLPMMLIETGGGVEAVEIDPVIDAMAREHFALDLPGDRVHLADARVFLERTGNRYDYVFMDAFSADQIPWHLLSREAFELTRTRLRDGGVVALNTVTLPGSDEVASVYATLSSVFAHVRAFNHSPDPGLSNIVFLASDAPIALVPFPKGLDRVAADIALDYLRGEIQDLSSGLVLTDDYNPINHLHEPAQARWREDMRALLGREYYDWAFY